MTINPSMQYNLDDETEVSSFIAAYGTLKGRALANLLEMHGKGSAIAATALSCYAWNKHTAIQCRKRGDIQTAMQYELICDSIYQRMDAAIRW